MFLKITTITKKYRLKLNNLNGYKAVLLLSALFIAGPIMAQSRTVKKATQKQEKTQEQQKKDDEKARQKGIKEHMDHQSNATKKQMKQTNKSAKKINSQNQDNFFERLIHKRNQKAKAKKRSLHRQH